MKDEILFQLNIAWELFLYHCKDLSEKEAMWCKTASGLQIQNVDGEWVSDWPDTEEYRIGPSSIAWTLWHILYWWKSTLSASKKNQIIEKEDVKWLGSVDLVIKEIEHCHDEWVDFIGSLSDHELQSTDLCRWPFENQSMCSLALWLNVELMKNAAEIGAARFLYATI